MNRPTTTDSINGKTKLPFQPPPPKRAYLKIGLRVDPLRLCATANLELPCSPASHSKVNLRQHALRVDVPYLPYFLPAPGIYMMQFDIKLVHDHATTPQDFSGLNARVKSAQLTGYTQALHYSTAPVGTAGTVRKQTGTKTRTTPRLGGSNR
ncbi:hypothetical protein P167DRAFT_544693 [Morchella conica CCBAS932]|uniref:Uncharacterized protein n=1 Tax=Morchella conica CCBAS932 TaxID=1392247 RepID=A0A3N4KYC2_9PEZI|nr:hypothetical protein P167DRAFT_544693 [Morchella conica CCBAS932]